MREPLPEVVGHARGAGGGVAGTSAVFTLASANAATFGFPYGGPHHARLSVFSDDDGVSVMISVKGHFVQDAGGRLSVDEGEPVAISFDQASDHDPSVAFLSGAETVIGASTIKVEATFYQSGSRIFTFNAGKPLAQHATYVADRKRRTEEEEARARKQQEEAETARASAEREREEREGPGRFARIASIACAASSNSTDRMMQANALLRELQGDPCTAKPLVTPVLTDECIRRIEEDAPDSAAELRDYVKKPSCP